MKHAAYVVLILFAAAIVLWAINDFDLPEVFWFQETDKAKAEVVETNMQHIGRGYYLQQVIYSFTVDDSLYRGDFRAGQRQGRLETGDKLLVRYAVQNPSKSEVIGFYR